MTVFNGGNGNDFFEGANDFDTLIGNGGNDTLLGGDGVDWIEGNDDNDQLDGGGGDDTISGGNGSDNITGGSGNDFIFGGVDETNQVPHLGNDTIFGGDGQDQIFGSNGNDVISGGIGNDGLFGGLGNDTIEGGEGDDYLAGGAGVNRLTGGNGNDRYQIANLLDQIIETGTAADIDTILFDVAGTTSYTLTSEFENLQLLRGLNGTGNARNNVIFGNDGANTLQGLDGNDQLYGGRGINNALDGNDTLFGGNNNDVLRGDGGLDVLSGGSGRDCFVFSQLNQDGTDQITDFNSREDTIALYAADSISPGMNPGYAGMGLTINSVLRQDQFRIGNGALDASDRVIYQSSTGRLFFDPDGVGGLAQVQIATLTPNLTLSHHNLFVFSRYDILGSIPLPPPSNVINGTNASETLRGNAAANTIRGFGGNDVLLGNGGNDNLDGGVGNDRLLGGAGNDALDGADGNDVLLGGLGADRLIGGAGTDRFVLARRQGRDTIVDFQNGLDRLVLTGGLRFRDLRMTQVGNNTLVQAGNESLALLTGIATTQINAADFVIG